MILPVTLLISQDKAIKTNKKFEEAYYDNTKGKKKFAQVEDPIESMCMQLVMLYHH
jgi:hypothetical protein